MEVTRTERGYQLIEYVMYPPDEKETKSRLVQASSAIGNYQDADRFPGTSYLWIGHDHHLNREDVEELVEHLNRWLFSGSLDGPLEEEVGHDADVREEG